MKGKITFSVLVENGAPFSAKLLPRKKKTYWNQTPNYRFAEGVG